MNANECELWENKYDENVAIAFVITLNFSNYKLSLKTFNEFEPVGSVLVLQCLSYHCMKMSYIGSRPIY